MQIEFILSPLAQCVFLALVLIGCLALFVSIKLEIAVVRSSFNKSRESAAASNETLVTELATLRKEIGSTEVALPTGQELSRATRAQALSMQSRGESPKTIAAALRAPRNEIDLLLKIQKLTNDYGKQSTTGR